MEIKLCDRQQSREKALRSIANTGFLNVWEGAVRSGKTVYALVSFAHYIIRSPERVFLLSGRTVKTIESNCITEEYGLLNMIPGSVYVKGAGEILFSVKVGNDLIKKKIKVFGAADIRSYMALRGNSYGGWFADEINMHDQTFVQEAINRTVVSEDRKHFWTLNPDNPHHWIYKDFLNYYDSLSKEDRKNLGGYHWWHFTPTDNPAMTDDMIASLELQYPKGSYLYRRYVLGERCIAEGLIYPKVDASHFRDFDVTKVDIRYCAIDFGADHPTVMVFGGIFNGNKNDWRAVKEYYDKGSDKTTYDHYVAFLDICKELKVDPNKITIAIDPAALPLKVEFRNHGLNVVNAKNDVLAGISYMRTLLYSGRLMFHSSMVHHLEEFGGYAWDSKASERGEDKPIKVNDDCMDASRYFAYTFIKQYIQ